MRGFGGHALEPSIQHGIARAHLVHDVLRLRSGYSEIAGERNRAFAVDATENHCFINLPLLLSRIENTERRCCEFAVRIAAQIVRDQCGIARQKSGDTNFLSTVIDLRDRHARQRLHE